MNNINVFKPCIDEREVEAVREVLLSGWLGMGPKTKEFEEKFSRFIDMPYAIGLNSCTAALDMAVRLLNLSPDDEVIVPTITFVSTAHAVLYNRAKVVFADIEPETLLIDLNHVKNIITKKTKAIIVVHYGGQCVDIPRLRQMLDPSIKIIEDCAHATGTSLNGRPAGSLGDMSCFSFQAVKNLCMGDGGLLALHSQEDFLRAKRLRWLGIDKGTWDRTSEDKTYWWEYNVDEIGYKNHMNDILASIGLVQLDKLETMNAYRREIAFRYGKELAGIGDLSFPKFDEDHKKFKSSWHIYWLNTSHRDDLAVFLSDNGIATGVHYKPIHLYQCYNNTQYLPVAEDIWKKILTLPMYPGLTPEDVSYIIEKIKEFFNEKK